MAGHAIGETFRACGVKIVDSLYALSVYSIIAYSGILLLLAVIGAAVFFQLVEVPEFHPK